MSTENGSPSTRDEATGETGVTSTQGPLHIPHTHPALPGHFPGQPIVPGVVLLDQVIETAQKWLGRELRVQLLKQAKFLSPLLPDQQAQIDLKLRDDELRFNVTRDGEAIAQGVMSVRVEAAP